MRPKILAVDDSRSVRLIVKKTFKNYDCEIVEAGNGEEGLEVAAREMPQLILLDVTMPILDGYEMLLKLKDDMTLRNIPVIMLTVEASREMVIKIAKLGVRDYIIKPFEESSLVEKVLRVVDLKQIESTSDDSSANKKQSGEGSCNILIVDDQPAIVEKFKNGLAHLNWNFRSAASKEVALAQISRDAPDAVIISLALSDQSEWDLQSAIRKQAPNIPIYAMALRTATADKERAEKAGFNAIFFKPLDMHEIEQTLTKMMNPGGSAGYFSVAGDTLVLKLTQTPSADELKQIDACARDRVTSAVNSGMDSLLFDLSTVKTLSRESISEMVNVAAVAKELGLPCKLKTNAAIDKACHEAAELRNWEYVN